ncbi:DNA repair protein RadA/Sms [Desulfacinum infernum DSM 9756]|uniref:DNA repair protein RadA n=1 Tax=Desulfacinum infernum DSM 9756 TaxID=1121391 RepID=A0A1M4X0S3_9BACT|nr:DNA repair protein RadA [Desulfacinum infernum]SHE87106.1 DNA repair protein RadA/Sms [Desulfacinum infernum DSM 9756]
MAREKALYRCQECGYESPKWLGRCPGCQAWNSFVEEAPAVAGPGRRAAKGQAAQALPLGAVPTSADRRLQSGMQEWDRVLGGGLVPGSVVLLAGDPGIGKSTLLLQALARLARSGPVLYVSGEESLSQIRLRAERLGLGLSDHVLVCAETSVDAVVPLLESTKFLAVAVDSIQTMRLDLLESAPGSVSQVRESTAWLQRVAKEKDTGILLVGHVTKEGVVAGPRVLEHLVDAVLYLEGDRTHAFRLLRAVKNRFGSTNEIGVFEMKETGLEQVPNPSRFLLAERPAGVPGSVVTCAMEGTRPLLVEVQALVSPTGWAQPRRASMGVDGNRLSLLLAVLEKKLGVGFAQQDVFVNVAGGVRLAETAADLAVVLAVLSSALDVSLPDDLVAWGEVGLAGEVRGVGHASRRLSEALSLGFGTIMCPRSNQEQLNGAKGVSCRAVRSLREVLDEFFS